MSVEIGGTVLQLAVEWPKAMLDMDVLLSDKFLSVSDGKNEFSTFHPMYLAFENPLGSMRERINDGIDSVARFPQPCAAETHIHGIRPLVQPRSGCKILRVTLCACAEAYTVVNNKTSFVEI